MDEFIKKVDAEKKEKETLEAQNEEENAKALEEKKNEELKKEREQKNKLNLVKKQKDRLTNAEILATVEQFNPYFSVRDKSDKERPFCRFLCSISPYPTTFHRLLS